MGCLNQYPASLGLSLIFPADVANDPAVNPNPIFEFPKTRNWDPWMNHGMASGFSFADNIGNNEEQPIKVASYLEHPRFSDGGHHNQ